MTKIPDQINLLKWVGLDGSKKGPDKKYPTFNIRMIAATIDSFLAMITVGPVFDVMMRYKPLDIQTVQAKMQQAATEQESAHIFMNALRESGIVDNIIMQTFMLLVITGICWHYWSATPGKLLLRMRVVDAKTEQPISLSQIILRLFGYILSVIPLGLGYFWITFDKRRQAWHDKFAGTVVIFKPKTPAAHPSVPQEPSESA